MQQDVKFSVQDHALRLAVHLFLKPDNVNQIFGHIGSQYALYRRRDPDAKEDNRERDYIPTLIQGLLRHPPRVQLSLSQESNVDKYKFSLLKMHGLLRFCGDATHQIPLEQLARLRLLDVLESLNVLMPQFLSTQADGLDGDLSMRSFSFDSLMQRIMEPSFLVMTCFLLHVTALKHTTGVQDGEEEQEIISRHLYTLRCISDEALSVTGALGCCDARDIEKMARTRRELSNLHRVLNTVSIDDAIDSVTKLWCEKAQWCEEQIYRECALDV